MAKEYPHALSHTRTQHSEDNCRDPQGNIDMQLQHLVMRELGLHTLVQFCESGMGGECCMVPDLKLAY